MADEDAPGVSRRQMLGGGAAAAALALAGCASQPQVDNTEQAATIMQQAADRSQPTKPAGLQLNTEYQQFVLKSLAYQNTILRLQSRALANYMTAETADAKNDG